MLHYTVWTHGRKIGETRLELRPSPRRRAGAFYPTEYGLGMLPDLRAVREASAIEVRDPTGSPMYWESLVVTDLAEMVASAKMRRPNVATEASTTLRDSVKFVISLTFGDGNESSAAESPQTQRGLLREGASREHPAAQHRKPTTY